MDRQLLKKQLEVLDHPQAKDIYHFITCEPQCFERECKEGHVTGSALVLNHDHSQVLLTYHRKLNRWLQLGGHSDGNPNTKDVALREAQEESGIHNLEFVTQEIIDVDIHLIPRSQNEPEHYHYDIRFLLRAPEGSQIKKSSESKDLRWFTAEDVKKLKTDKSVLHLVDIWKTKFSEYNRASL